jgi:hypothetical protein
MTDQDVLDRVDEVNKLKGQEADLERKKKLIQQEIKSIQTEIEQKFNNIARREEDREVECDVSFNYDTKEVTVTFLGEVMESRRMSEWEFSTRPEDIFPETKKSKVSKETSKAINHESSLADAVARADEIAQKEKNNQVPSGDVKAFSEAKTETAVEGLNV